MNAVTFDFPVCRNPLKTRDDLKRSLEELLSPLKAHAAPGGWHLGSASAQYPPKIARMEGWSRCLWGIAPFMARGGVWLAADELRATLSRGVDPGDRAYWGDCGRRDQRLVEMAAIALSLVLAPDVFWEPLDRKVRQNLYRWLSFIEKEELPPTNWHFFRLMVQAAFRKLGLPVDSRAEEASFEVVESCYRGNGWYQDGDGGSFDLYNPMGFHFYSLVLTAVEEKRWSLPGASDPPVRRFAERFRERAGEFAPSFAAWFYRDGSMIPFGRSLTYRFAGVSFFAACAFAGLEALPWGVMKGIVLRNLRRWFSLPILDAGGLLSVGYAYPNLIMADAYNSPGSPYWALKTYLVLALGEEHPFWQAEEAPLPETLSLTAQKIPGFIVSSGADDAQLLNAGRYPNFDMNHAAQKYCKFAYSARFGFCVSHSNYNIEKTGCDSALLFSEGDGYWRERRETTEQETGPNWVRSRWRPWADVDVVTALIRLAAGWHVRVHRVQSGRPLLAVEGGFAVPRFNDVDDAPPVQNAAVPEAEALALYPWAASRIAALEGGFPGAVRPQVPRRGILVVPAPNLNVIHPVVAIPALEGRLEPGTAFLACAVWAGDGAPAGSGATVPGGGHLPKAAVQEKDPGHWDLTIFDRSGGIAAQIAI